MPKTLAGPTVSRSVLQNKQRPEVFQRGRVPSRSAKGVRYVPIDRPYLIDVNGLISDSTVHDLTEDSQIE